MMDRSTLRIALRTLSRHRGFTVVAVLSLAIAIALNTTMYSALDALIYPRIAAKKPENVYMFWYHAYQGHRMVRMNVDDVDLERAMRTAGRGVEDLSGFGGPARWFGSRGQPLAENGERYRRVSPMVVRSNFFDFLGTPALEGRTFRSDDESEATAAVISDRLADYIYPNESPVGQTLMLDGRGFAVIGVVKRTSVFSPLYGDVWILRQASSAPVPLNLVRFEDRVGIVEGREDLYMASAQLAQAAGGSATEAGFRLSPMHVGKFQFTRFHLALIGAVAAVLLVACANLANLQLARGLARSRELALRSAVGASRRQLIRLLVLESGVLAVMGLTLGVIMTLWGIELITASIPPSINDVVVEPQTSWRVFAFAAGAAVLCLFLVGLVPALRISRVDPNDLLKAGAGTGANRQHRRRYGLMVVAQIGFALPVLIGAIVVLKESVRLASPEYIYRGYGYDPRPMISARVPFRAAPGQPLRVGDAAAEVVSRAKTVPNVIEAAGVTSREPLRHRVSVDDANGVIREEPAHLWSYRIVSPTYFRAVGQTIGRGRDFVEGESDGKSLIIDAATAKFLWGNNQDPIGRVIKFGPRDADLPWLRVVGIVHDPRDTFAIRRMDYTAGYRLAGVWRVITPQDTANQRDAWSMSVRIRVRGNTELAAVRLQRALRTLRSTENATVVPLTDEMGLAQARTQQDFVSSLFTTFALLGLGLVAIGVYGIVSHSVVERKRELAVRISFGATARDILRAVLREGNALILAGVAIGLLLTKYTVWWLDRFMEENDGYNALLFALIAAGLFVIAVFAAFIPAWRATRIDPVEALRSE
jgi:putative ABC transport system permease protein